jgi:prevent-host-death family protein
MSTLSIAETRDHLAETINRVSYGGERVIVARRGKPVAALISPADLALLERIEDDEDVQVARQVLEEYDRDPNSFISLSDYQSGKRAR